MIAIPTESLDVQTQHIGQSTDPKPFCRSLFLLTVATVIELRLGEFLDRNKARETVGEVAGRKVLLVATVVRFLVEFLGNVE